MVALETSKRMQPTGGDVGLNFYGPKWIANHEEGYIILSSRLNGIHHELIRFDKIAISHDNRSPIEGFLCFYQPSDHSGKWETESGPEWAYRLGVYLCRIQDRPWRLVSRFLDP